MALTEQQRQALKNRNSKRPTPDELPEQIADELPEQTGVVTIEGFEPLEDELEGIEFFPGEHQVATYAQPAGNFAIVEGLHIPPTMPIEQKEALLETIFSYVGVIPQPIDSYVGKWLTVLGCVIVPIEHDTGEEVIDEQTGEVKQKILRWNQPLFKLARKNDDDQHVIIAGGGKYGMLFARQMTSVFGPGDWASPKQVMISQEARTSSTGQPRRMYRFNYQRRSK